jgi:hypothetical protein
MAKKCRIAGKSQAVLVTINPMISTRTPYDQPAPPPLAVLAVAADARACP